MPKGEGDACFNFIMGFFLALSCIPYGTYIRSFVSLSLTAEEEITWMNHTIVVVVLAGDSIKFGHG